MMKGSVALRNSIKYSQNFLKDQNLAEQLVANSSITNSDVVYEIGSGKGIITEILASHCKSVIAIETDPNLAIKLKQKFQHASNVQIQEIDFLVYSLPKYNYKVFSNIPFNITASIVRKLVYAPVPPEDCYLIIQQEAAIKLAGTPDKEMLFSILIKPLFELSIIHHFKRTDFIPEPNVSIVLLRIHKRNVPLILEGQNSMYKDFVSYAFNRSIPDLRNGMKHIFTSNQFSRLARDFQFKESITPSQLTFDQWLSLFKSFVVLVDTKKRQIVYGSEARLRKEQSQIDKIHRTRVSKHWKQEGIKLKHDQ